MRRPRGKAKLRQTFARQRGEETLGHGMIVRVAAGVHGVTRANATLRHERRAQRRIQKLTGKSRHFGTFRALFVDCTYKRQRIMRGELVRA